MKTYEEALRIPKMEFDSLCPFCRSRAVYLVGAHRTNAGDPENDPANSGIYVEDWSCAVCYRSFELF
jgi:hypothetical protein